MRFSRPVLFLSSLPALAAPLVAAAARPDEPDRPVPFLSTPAYTVPALLREVRQSAGARARYARFFQVPVDQTIPYLKSRLAPSVVPATAPYTVYYVSHKGTVYPVWLTLPAGARVFDDAHGVPVLLCSTGDPLVPPLWATPAHTLHAKAR